MAAIVRGLFRRGRKSKGANGSPAKMSAEETTDQMATLSLNGAANAVGQDGEVATFALS